MEGRASRREPNDLRADWGLRVLAQLPGAVRQVLAECQARPPRPLQEMRHAVVDYLRLLRRQAQQVEFLDLETAERAARGCLHLITTAEHVSDPARERAIQAAVEYFLRRADAEDDLSIVGFDDDLQVIRTTAEVLGHPLEGGTGGG